MAHTPRTEGPVARHDVTVVNDLQEGPGELERTPPQFSFEVGDGAKPLKKSEKEGRGDQDRGIFDNDGIAIVCDGMGSLTGGETADTVASSLYEGVNSGQLNGMNEVDAIIHIEGVLIAANSAVGKKLADGELEAGSGTTLGAVIPFTDNEGKQKAAIIGVGDTPVMRARGSTLTRLTDEETKGAKAHADTGTYDEKKAAIITNGFNGKQSKLNLDGDNVTVVDVEDGDRFLVTSDGIEEFYNDPPRYPAIPEQFTNLICGATTPQEIATELVSRKIKKTDDRLVYVVEAQENKPIQPEQPEADSSTDGEATPPKRRRGKRGGGKQRRRKEASDARAAAKAARADLPSADPDDVPNPIGEDWDPIDATNGDQPYDREAQDPEGDWEGAEPSDDGSDPFDAWRPFFEGNDRDDDSADPDFSHLPPPPDFSHLPPPPDFSHLPPPPDASSGNPGHGESDDATSYPPEQRTMFERGERVAELRQTLADMQTKKRWSFAYGFIHRKEMEQLRKQYGEATKRYNESVIFNEIRNGSLDSENYDSVLDRVEELEAEEGAQFIDANTQAELTRYGKAIRWVGDKLYGKERSLKRKIIAGAGMGTVAIGAAIFAPALPAIATVAVGLRLTRTVAGGVYGHDSEEGTKRILKKVTDNAAKEQSGRDPVESITGAAATPEERARLLTNRTSNFKDIYLDSINRSDTKRRVASAVGQIVGIGAIMNAAHLLPDVVDKIKMPKLPFTGGDSSTGSGFKNLSPDDVQKFKDASPGISQETLGAIDKNPEAFSRFVTTGQEIKQSTGLNGAALNERLADTLALAHDKNEYIAAARGSGISAEAAGAAFDNRMAEMVFADAVSHIRETTGLSGAELLKRVENTAALAQARDSFVSQGATATERFNRGVLFDEQFRQFAAKLKTQ